MSENPEDVVRTITETLSVDDVEMVVSELLRWLNTQQPKAAPDWLKNLSPKRIAILNTLIRAGKPMRLMHIAAATGMVPTNTAALLYRMRADGQTKSMDLGFYRHWCATAQVLEATKSAV